MKKKGFTLIELLAVVIVLGILAAVAIPRIAGITEASNRSIFKQNISSVLKEITYETMDGVDFSEGVDINTLAINDNYFDSGTISIINNRKYVENLTDGEYCATGYIDDLSIVKGECSTLSPTCSLEIVGNPNNNGWFGSYPSVRVTTSLAGELDISYGGGYSEVYDNTVTDGNTGIYDYNLDPLETVNNINTFNCYVKTNDDNKNTSSIDVKVDTTAPSLTSSISSSGASIIINTSALDSESGVSGYRYSLDGGTTFEPTGQTTNSNYVFTGLTSGTHNIVVRAYNNAGLYTDYTENVNVVTSLDVPTFSDPGTNWSTSKDITVSFTGPGVYFINAENTVSSSVEGLECSITDATYTCTTNSTNTFTPGNWYKVEENPALTLGEDGYVVAKVVDNISLSESATFNVVNIDTTLPTINVDPVAVSIKDNETYDLNTGVTCADNVSCTITHTTDYTEGVAGNYTVNYTATDLAGNTATESRTIEVTTSVSIGTEYTFDYTGGVQTLPITTTGVYKVEVWGAQGATYNSTATGGKGGYSTGNISLNANETLYIAVGGAGAKLYGGYNGGGNGSSGSEAQHWRGGGGGATHIGKSDAILKNTSVDNLYIVAGGGGGAGADTAYTGRGNGGTGGGTSGGNAGGTGGTQSSGYAYGQGANSSYSAGLNFCGGGGGYYGGQKGNYYFGGGGGSGYLSPSLTDASMENGIRSGNGYAKVTYLGTAADVAVGTEYLFSFTGSSQTFLVPFDGNYKIEAWGAQGGGSVPGKGAYTAGNITLSKDNSLYIYVGEYSSFTSGACYESNDNASFNALLEGSCVGGGGASDVRLTNGDWFNDASLNSRIIVAAGGGGRLDAYGGSGGSGGGLIGYDGIGTGSNSSYSVGTGGTQTSGYAFGIAGRSTTGGGGGYYGGYQGSGGNAGGGSSFISGHTGSVAITSSSDRTPKSGCTTGTTSNSCSLHYSGNFFTDTVMIDGKGYSWTNVKGAYTGMPTHDGTSTMAGNSGNGYVKITYLGT